MPVAVRLGIPDLVGAGESTAEVIAGRLNADQDAVYRILRCLAGIGMLTEERSGVFALTPMGKQLTVDAPFGLPALARMLGDSSVQRAFERLDDSVRTGRSAFDLEFGVDFFDYLGQNPEFSDLFNSAMGQNARLVADALPNATISVVLGPSWTSAVGTRACWPRFSVRTSRTIGPAMIAPRFCAISAPLSPMTDAS